jgi:hypothetical protein
MKALFIGILMIVLATSSFALASPVQDVQATSPYPIVGECPESQYPIVGECQDTDVGPYESDIISGDIYLDSASVNTGTNEGTVEVMPKPGRKVTCPECGHTFVVYP